jgi:hypothetical protein
MRKKPELNQENHLVPPKPVLSQLRRDHDRGQGCLIVVVLRVGIDHKRPSDQWASAAEGNDGGIFPLPAEFCGKQYFLPKKREHSNAYHRVMS